MSHLSYYTVEGLEKLKNDVKEVLKGNLEPDTKRTMTKDKDGKVKVNIKMKNKKH